MNRDICAQIDTRLVNLFDSIPDAGSKTPQEFFSAVFSDEAKGRASLSMNAIRRTFVHNIVASKLPEADEMVSAIINLITTSHRYLDQLINAGDNLVADACKSGSNERIELVLKTGFGRGKLAEIDQQGKLKIFNTDPESLMKVEDFFRSWRSEAKNKSLFDYFVEERTKPANLSQLLPSEWDALARVFPDKISQINQLKEKFKPKSKSAAAVYKAGQVDKFLAVLETSAGMASLTEVDAQGKLEIFGSNYELLFSRLGIEIDQYHIINLEGFYKRWRSNGEEKSLLDFCLEAATRQENPIKFHPSVWHLLRRVFVAQFVDHSEPSDEAIISYPGDFVNQDSVTSLDSFTEDLVQMSADDFNTTEGRLKAYALDRNGKTPLQLAAERDDHELVRMIVDTAVSCDAIYINSGELLRNAGEKSAEILVSKLRSFVSRQLKPNKYRDETSEFLTRANPNLLKAVLKVFYSEIIHRSLGDLVIAANTNVLKVLIERDKDKVLAKILAVLPDLLSNKSKTALILFDFVKENYAIDEQEKLAAVQGNKGMTLFHVAAYFGNVDVIRAVYATEAGKKAAQVSNSESGAPLVLALRRGKVNLAAIEELLKYPEVQATLELVSSEQKNIFHPYGYRDIVAPEVLRLVLRTFPRLVNLLAQEDISGNIPISSFEDEHLQVLVELASEIEGFALPSGCIPCLVNRFLMNGNAGLIPMITASEEGKAALGGLDAQGILPLRRAMYSGDLDRVKNLLACDIVKENMAVLNKNGETIFHSFGYVANSQIKPEILSYVLENYPESRKLLLQAGNAVSPLRQFNIGQLQIAFGYLSKEAVEEVLLSTTEHANNLVQTAFVKLGESDTSGYEHDNARKKVEYLLGEIKKCSDADKKKAIFTQEVEDIEGVKRKFLDTLPEFARKLIPQELLTLELDQCTLAAFVGMIRCAASKEQARAVLNAADESGLSLYYRISPEQRAVLDSVFVDMSAVNSVLAATTVAAAVPVEHASSTSLQSDMPVDGALVNVQNKSMKKRSGTEALLNDHYKTHRNIDGESR